MQTLERSLTYTETTDDIRITVTPNFLEEHSDLQESIYAFAYTVTIENFGEDTVQLLRRHWIVTSGGSLYTEVIGDGVVGEQPVLEPGDLFQYTSSSVIKDAHGSMYGTYTFRAVEGEFFEVVIPEFDLVHNILIH